MRRKGKMCRSVSQETCLMLKEKLPKKVQFLFERFYLLRMPVFFWNRHFYLWNAQCVEPYKHPEPEDTDGRFWQTVTAFSLLRPAASFVLCFLCHCSQENDRSMEGCTGNLSISRSIVPFFNSGPLYRSLSSPGGEQMRKKRTYCG